jgi:two-component system, NtrC family, sensor kinase
MHFDRSLHGQCLYYSHQSSLPSLAAREVESELNMEHIETAKNGPDESNLAERRQQYYSRLFRKFILLTILCSLVPLLLVGWGINLHYTRFAKERMLNYLQTQVEHHKKIIELFLAENSAKLQLIAQSHSLDFLTRASNLSDIFEMINRDFLVITDLGVIGSDGRHLAYIGPYDLMSKNYSETFWFKEVMEKGLFISDMFMGFRKEPHFIIAVTRLENDRTWILRATINTDVFRSLVENVRIGKTGEVYLLNREGIFQTTPRFSGKIMEQAPYPLTAFHLDPQVRILEPAKNEGDATIPRQIVCETWLENPPWLLVVKQNYAEAFTEVNHANYATLIFLHLSALTILIVTVLITRHMISVIKKRDSEADQLSRQLMQTGKLAAIGQLSAGVAHEINNPLAIVLTERQLLLDAARQYPIRQPEFESQFSDSMTQIDVQVQRCKRITQNLLRFSRRTESLLESVDINQFIKEVIELMEREARASGIKFFAELDDGLPPLISDPSQLQQVFLNMITNAIDAHDGKPYGSIRIKTRPDAKRTGSKSHLPIREQGLHQKTWKKYLILFSPPSRWEKAPVWAYRSAIPLCSSWAAVSRFTVNREKEPNSPCSFRIPRRMNCGSIWKNDWKC